MCQSSQFHRLWHGESCGYNPCMTTPLLNAAQLRILEAGYAKADPSLMERAGQAATVLALSILGGQRTKVLTFAGPGNNGGDARVLAKLLLRQGVSVDVCSVGEEPRSRDYGLVVDGLFGIGLTRPITGDYAQLIERINAFPGPILALDLPSGLNGDTGQTLGATVRATHTASFIAAKPGLFTLDGPDHCGAVSIHGLGVVLDGAYPGALLGLGDFRALLRPRSRNSHKGNFGSLAVIGGAPGMAGAALLAARAGLHLGAGRTFVGLLDSMAVDFWQPELMLRSVEDASSQGTVLVVGPGLGESAAAYDLLQRVVSSSASLLLDADALNLLAAHPVLATRVCRRDSATIITPHPAEAARLLATDIAHVQADRVAAALTLAQRLKAMVALKGNGTVVAHPDGRWRINTTGNAGLATGGSGDVLAGVAGALLAQNWPAWEALCGAVHLHGSAADQLVSQGHGPVGLTASELVPAARIVLNRLIAEHTRRA